MRYEGSWRIKTDMLDRKILERLFRQNYSGMIRLASVLLGNDKEAEDVVQDVFERLMRPESTASITNGYLMTAVHHGCLNVIRKKKLQEQVSNFYPVEMEEEINPISRQLDQLAEIQHCIDKMEEPCHSILRMRFDDEQTIREIAEHTKLSIGTVHKYLHQGIQQIKLHLNQERS